MLPKEILTQHSRNKWRLCFVQRLIDSFWEKWTVLYFPNLLIRKKWHQQQRNVCVNDFVIIKDRDLPRGKWKLRLVSKVTEDVDGVVRRVLVKYKNINSNVYVEIERLVQNLIIITTNEEDQ